MKILIISRTPWDEANSFGNTFSNLFSGLNDVDIYHICCQNGVNNNAIVKRSFQMTDGTVLRSILKRGCAGREVNLSGKKQEARDVVIKTPKGRKTIYLIVRDIIWSLGHWNDKALNTYLDEVSPDIIYLPVYASWYMCDVQKRIIDYCKVPVAGHITDDVYSMPPNTMSQPIFSFYRWRLRKKLRRLLAKVSYIDVFAENMAYEYAKIFNKPCYVIGKGIDINNLTEIPRQEELSTPVKFVYTGNVGNNRYVELAKLGRYLDKYYADGGATLLIYTQTLLTDTMRTVFASCRSVKLCGSISSEEVKKVQQQADVLVHVESFDEQSIFETRMSFSTKLIDYMQTGKLIFAIGPKDVNSISVLKNNGLALVACSENEIDKSVQELKEGKINRHLYWNNTIVYLRNRRDIKVIQSEMKSRLDKIRNNGI